MTDSPYSGDSANAYFAIRAPRRTADAQRASARAFLRYVRRDDTVLDFGCGTGGILGWLPCAGRVGIEVNEPSAEIARASGIDVHADLTSVAREAVDIAIAHHSLEHVGNPLGVLRDLLSVLRTGGRLVVVVPAESRRDPVRPGLDPDRHLFSWTPKTLANLVHEAGFVVVDTYREQAGYSHYISRLEAFPRLLSLAEQFVALVLGRHQNVCYAVKPPAPAGDVSTRTQDHRTT